MKRYIRKRFLIVLIVVGALSAAAYVAVRMMIDPEAVRAKAVARLSELTGVDVSIADATFDPLLGLVLDNLTLSTQDHEGHPKLLARMPRVRLLHERSSLFNGKLRFHHVDIRDAEFFIERLGGRYNIEPLLDALLRHSGGDDPIPTVRLDRVVFGYTDSGLGDASGCPLSARLENVSVSMAPAGGGSRKFNVNLSVNDPCFGRWTVRDGEFDTGAGTLSFEAKSSAVPLNDRLKERLTGRTREIWDRFSPHGGTVRLVANFRYDAHSEEPVQFDVRARFDDVSGSYSRFPYEITDVSGTLIFRPGGIELEEVRGRSGSSPVTFEGSVGGYRRGCRVDMRIEGKGIPLDAKLRAAFEPARRQLWDDLNPEGRTDIVCKLDREGRPGEDMRVRVLAKNTSGTSVATRYRSFPYPLQLSGCVFYDAGDVTIVAEPTSTAQLAGFSPGVLLARHGDMMLEVSGGTSGGTPRRLARFDFRLRGDGRLPLDDDLKRALSPAMQQIWDYLGLAGSTRGTCRVERTDCQEPGLDIAVELTDIRSRLRCRDFPYELRDPGGSVSYERSAARFPRGRLHVENVSTYHDGVLVEINGEISGFRAGRPTEHMDLTIQAANVPLDDNLRRAVPPGFAALWQNLSPTPQSRVNVRCRLDRRDPGMERPDVSLRIESIDSSLMCSTFPYRVSHLRGAAEYERNEQFPEGLLRLRDLECSGGDFPIGIRGLLSGFSADKGIDTVHLIIEGRAVPLDDKLRTALRPKHRRMFDAFGPEGTADVVCTVKGKPRTGDLSAELSITPLGSSICCDRFPLGLTDVGGRIHIADGVVRVQKMRGRADGGIVTLDGVLQSSSTEQPVDFTVHGEDITLGCELERALPERQRELWRRLAPGGKVTFDVTVKEPPDGRGGEDRIYSAVIRPDGASLRPGLRLDGLSGEIRLDGTLSAKGHDFRGRADLSTATVSGTRFTQVRGSFEKHGGLFNVYEMSGRVYGGEVAGQCRVQLGDPITYGVVADARSLQLSTFLQAAFGTRTEKLQGLLSGRLLLQGKGTDADTLVGRADLRVREGRLWEIPFVLALLKVLNLSSPESTAFTEATARLEFYNRHVDVKRLNLLGNAVSVYGEGTVKRSGVVDLNFATGFGRFRLPDLPIISPVVKELQRQIVLVKMTGTLREPKLEVLPIAPLTSPMKDLVEHLAASDRTAGEAK